MTIRIKLRQIGDRWSVELHIGDQMVLIGPLYKTRLEAEELIATLDFKKPRRLKLSPYGKSRHLNYLKGKAT